MGQWGKEERGGDTPGFCIHRPPPPPDMKSLIKHWSSSSGSAFITSHTNAFTHTSSHRHSSSASWHTKPTSTRERHPSTKKTQKTENYCKLLQEARDVWHSPPPRHWCNSRNGELVGLLSVTVDRADVFAASTSCDATASCIYVDDGDDDVICGLS